jgi:hypothetical protein
MAKKKKRTAPRGDSYKRGYANGITAAAEAVLGDLNEHGLLDDVSYGEDGYADDCNACILDGHHFPRLAGRLSFAYELAGGHGPHRQRDGAGDDGVA